MELVTQVVTEIAIVDDDGVAVIASQRALEQRYAHQRFDYEFVVRPR
jgi:hypothetical protein